MTPESAKARGPPCSCGPVGPEVDVLAALVLMTPLLAAQPRKAAGLGSSRSDSLMRRLASSSWPTRHLA